MDCWVLVAQIWLGLFLGVSGLALSIGGVLLSLGIFLPSRYGSGRFEVFLIELCRVTVGYGDLL